MWHGSLHVASFHAFGHAPHPTQWSMSWRYWFLAVLWWSMMCDADVLQLRELVGRLTWKKCSGKIWHSKSCASCPCQLTTTPCLPPPRARHGQWPGQLQPNQPKGATSLLKSSHRSERPHSFLSFRSFLSLFEREKAALKCHKGLRPAWSLAKQSP